MPKAQNNTQLRCFVFTWNNYQRRDMVKLEADDWFKYCVVGMEVGDNGTPHLQGYVELKTRKRFLQLKERYPKMHIEKRRGTAAQAGDYCKKDGDFLEFGETRKQGARTDLTRLKKRVRKGEKRFEIIRDCSNYQQIRYVEKLFEYVRPSLEWSPRNVLWYYGPAGTGKTRAAVDYVKEKGPVYVAMTGQWFDGYDGEDYVIIDDLRAKNWPYSLMLRLLDGYEVRVPIKGGHVIWKPSTVIITTPLPPEATYPLTNEHVDGGIGQLKRRITLEQFFAPPEPEPIVMEPWDPYENTI